MFSLIVKKNYAVFAVTKRIKFLEYLLRFFPHYTIGVVNTRFFYVACFEVCI